MISGYGRKLDHFIPGMIGGLAAPVLGVFIYYFVQSVEMGGLSVSDYRLMLAKPNILSMILSWCLLVNLGLFVLADRLSMAEAARGVIGATMVYGLVIIILKLL